YALGPARRELETGTAERRYMLTMTLVPLAIFALFGALTPTKFHWIVPVWLGMLPMLAGTVWMPGTPAGNGLKWIRTAWKPLLPASLAAAGLALHYAALGLPGLPWQPHRLGYMGWPEIAERVHEIEQRVERDSGRRPIVAGLAKWGIPAALTFHDVDGRVDNITARNIVGMSGSQWERWFDPDTDPARPVILVSHESKRIDDEWLSGALIGLGPLNRETVYRDGRPVQFLYWRVADGFRPEQLRYPGHIPE
ncbi:MAG: hypothetical protein R3323_07420, partial [Wenzhouxiangellaceae bacterium]|nr:hypothetical protein [Wenzhouxiangellaceae bacterium]